MLELVQRRVHRLVERSVEFLEELDPVEVFLLDFVELAFHAGGELHVHDLGERLHQFVGDDRPKHRRVEPAVDLLDVFAVLDC